MMSGKAARFTAAVAAITFAGVACGHVDAEGSKPTQLLIRIAELEIDPAKLDEYKAALMQEIEDSVRLEAGVLALNAVSINGNPAQIRSLEVYASREAYEAHLRSPHFVRYKVSTEKMVKSLKLLPTTPIRLCSKAGFVPEGLPNCM